MQALLVDYGSGNLRSAAKALERSGFEVVISSSPSAASQAQAIVVPGQGHFRQVVENFEASGFKKPLLEAIRAGVPLLGICVGMQLLFETSDEAPGLEGLGVLGGHLERFETHHPVPQMQWNTLEQVGDSPLMRNLPTQPFAYFVHSYYVPITVDVDAGAVTEYGEPFWSVFSQGNLHATQFHPEKSGAVGMAVLRRFREQVLLGA